MEKVWQNVGLFAIFFARTASFLFILPILGNRSVPVPAKIGLAAFVSIFLLSVLGGAANRLPEALLPFILVVVGEVLVGLALGFVTQFLFTGVQMAGELVGIQMGFGLARVMDPEFQTQVSIMGEFQLLVVLLIYLSIDGHHFLMEGFARSYQTIPVAGVVVGRGVVEHLVGMASGMFESAVKIGAPAIVALLLTNFTLGVLARTVPQMNVFIVGLPLKIAVGFLSLALTMTLFMHVFRNLWSHFRLDFTVFLELF